MNDEEEHRPTITRLTRDLVMASSTLSEDEARFLVDAYYQHQESRKRAASQVRSMKDEPHTTLAWLSEQNATLEGQIKRVLQSYAQSKDIGQWMMSIYGIGPVISAGLMAHIDINRAPTVGHIWRFAGLDPTLVWNKNTKRPWNAGLKTLCWKIGQSFMKLGGEYGDLYRKRKEYEIKRNNSGEMAGAAAEILLTKKFRKDTEAYKHLSTGKLPPAQIDARARRYAVKMFLSHLHTVWWFLEHNELPPKPYILEHGHAHYIPVVNAEDVPGLMEAMRKAGM